MHNTHLLGCAGQPSQTCFTHSAPILTLCNQPLTVNTQWPPFRVDSVRVPYVTSHSLQHQPKMKTDVMHTFLGTNTVYRSIRPLIWIRFCIAIMLKMSKSELFGLNIFIFSQLGISYTTIIPLLWGMSYLQYDSRICHREAQATLVFTPGRTCAKPFLFPVKPRCGLADFNTESIVCCFMQRVIWQFFCIIIKI